MLKKKLKSRSSSVVIRKVSEIDNPNSAVIYGGPGTGKTTIFGTWPGKKLLIDCNDRGTDSVSDIKNLDVAEARDFEDIEELYWDLAEGRLKYDSVGIDTTTGMQELCIQSVTGKKEPMTFASLSRKQFGEVSSRMKKTLVDFRDLDIHVAFLAQQRVFNVSEDDDAADGVPPEIGPAMMPSITTTLNASCNIIAQTYKRLDREKKQIGTKIKVKERIQYCLYVGPDPIRTTKIRKPKGVVPPSYLVDPTYEDLMDIIKGK